MDDIFGVFTIFKIFVWVLVGTGLVILILGAWIWYIRQKLEDRTGFGHAKPLIPPIFKVVLAVISLIVIIEYVKYILYIVQLVSKYQELIYFGIIGGIIMFIYMVMSQTKN